MGNAVEYSAFKLKKGMDTEEFLRISDEFQEGFLARQKGYVSRQLLLEGEQWADYVLWESLEDINNAFKIADSDPAAAKYLSCLNMNTCKTNLFTVEKNY